MIMTDEQKYLNGWKGLSDYLGGVPRTTLTKWVNEGKIQKYKIGSRVFFKKDEIDKALEQ